MVSHPVEHIRRVLPGDPRGFRNHKHRVHSSGDYKNLPPEGEHAGLHRYSINVMHRDPVTLDEGEREVARDAVVFKALSIGVELACVSVCRTHVHVLLKVERDLLDDAVARLKRHSSHVLRHSKPGRTWAARFHPVDVRDRQHQVGVFKYVVAHGPHERAAVWDCVRGAHGRYGSS
jgi:REP element-mobilizing transposase RayT